MILSKINEKRRLRNAFAAGIGLTAVGVTTVLTVFVPLVARSAELSATGTDIGALCVRTMVGLLLAGTGFAVMAAVFRAADKSAWMVDMSSDAADELPARPPCPDDFFTNADSP